MAIELPGRREDIAPDTTSYERINDNPAPAPKPVPVKAEPIPEAAPVEDLAQVISPERDYEAEFIAAEEEESGARSKVGTDTNAFSFNAPTALDFGNPDLNKVMQDADETRAKDQSQADKLKLDAERRGQLDSAMKVAQEKQYDFDPTNIEGYDAWTDQPNKEVPLSDIATGTGELVKAVPIGGIETTGTSIVGMAAYQAAKQRGKKEALKYIEELKRVPEMTKTELLEFRKRVIKENKDNNVLSLAVESAISDILNPATSGIGYTGGYKDVEDYLNQTLNVDEIPIQERYFYKIGTGINEWAAGLEKSGFFKPAEGWENSIPRQLGKGIGSSGSGLLLSWIGGPVAAGLFFTAAGSGEAIQRAVEFDKAERAAGRAGLTQDQIATAGIWGSAPGVTDVAPIEVLLGRIAVKVPQSLRKPLAIVIGKIGGKAFFDILGRVSVQAGIEGSQEMLQDTLQDLIEKHVYNPEKQVGETIVQSGGIGAGTGGIMQLGKEVLVGAARAYGKRKGGTTTPTTPEAGATPEAEITPAGEGVDPDLETINRDMEAARERAKAMVPTPEEAQSAVQAQEQLDAQIEKNKVITRPTEAIEAAQKRAEAAAPETQVAQAETGTATDVTAAPQNTPEQRYINRMRFDGSTKSDEELAAQYRQKVAARQAPAAPAEPAPPPPATRETAMAAVQESSSVRKEFSGYLKEAEKTGDFSLADVSIETGQTAEDGTPQTVTAKEALSAVDKRIRGVEAVMRGTTTDVNAGISKAGNRVVAEDTAEIIRLTNEFKKAGMAPESAAAQAVITVHQRLSQERDGIIEQARAQIPALDDALAEREVENIVADVAASVSPEELASDIAVAETQVEEAAIDVARSKFAQVLESTITRGKWAEAVGATPEILDQLINEAIADGRLEMYRGLPRRTGKRGVTKGRMGPTVPQARTTGDPIIGLKILRLPTAEMRQHARALYGAGTDSLRFVAALKALSDAVMGKTKTLNKAQLKAIAEVYAGRPFKSRINTREKILKALWTVHNKRVEDVRAALANGQDPELVESNLIPREDVLPVLQEMFNQLGLTESELKLGFIESIVLNGEEYQGLFDNKGILAPGVRALIALSLSNSPDGIMRTLNHESIHALRYLKVINDKAWAVLEGLARRKPSKKEALRLITRMLEDGLYPSSVDVGALKANAGKVTYREIYAIDARYEFDVAKVMKDNGLTQEQAIAWIEQSRIEEVVANVSEDWADGREYGTRVDRIMRAIEDFFERVKNAFAGRGFTNVNQIFDSAFSGRLTREWRQTTMAEALNVTESIAEDQRPALSEVVQKISDAVSEGINSDIVDANIAIIQQEIDNGADLVTAFRNLITAIQDDPQAVARIEHAMALSNEILTQGPKASVGRRTLSLPGAKDIAERRIKEQLGQMRRSDARHIFRPKAQLDWSELPDVEFFANVDHIAAKRAAASEKGTPPLNTPELVSDFVQDVLDNGAYSYLYEPENGAMSLNIVKNGRKFDKVLAISLNPVDNRMQVRTGFYQANRRTTRTMLKAYNDYGNSAVKWKPTLGATAEIQQRIVLAPPEQRGSAFDSFRDEIRVAQAEILGRAAATAKASKGKRGDVLGFKSRVRELAAGMSKKGTVDSIEAYFQNKGATTAEMRALGLQQLFARKRAEQATSGSNRPMTVTQEEVQQTIDLNTPNVMLQEKVYLGGEELTNLAIDVYVESMKSEYSIEENDAGEWEIFLYGDWIGESEPTQADAEAFLDNMLEQDARRMTDQELYAQVGFIGSDREDVAGEANYPGYTLAGQHNITDPTYREYALYVPESDEGVTVDTFWTESHFGPGNTIGHLMTTVAKMRPVDATHGISSIESRMLDAVDPSRRVQFDEATISSGAKLPKNMTVIYVNPQAVADNMGYTQYFPRTQAELEQDAADPASPQHEPAKQMLERQARLRDFMQEKRLSLPELGFTDAGTVEFTNGRNRFQVAREAGQYAIPVAVKTSEVQKFAEAGISTRPMTVITPRTMAPGALDVAVKAGTLTEKEAGQYAYYRGWKTSPWLRYYDPRMLYLDQIQSDLQQAYRDAVRNNAAQRLFGVPFKKLEREEQKIAVSQDIAEQRRNGIPEGGYDADKVIRLDLEISALNEKIKAAYPDGVLELNRALLLAGKRAGAYLELGDESLETLADRYEKVAAEAKVKMEAGDYSANLEYNDAMRRVRKYRHAIEAGKIYDENPQLRRDYELWKLKDEERRIAYQSAPYNPLTGDTDTTVQILVTRALMIAKDRGLSRIAIPDGNTVLSYNPGDEDGMEGFYDTIVPKVMRKVLNRLDKETPPPQTVEALRFYGENDAPGKVRVYEITDAALAKIEEEGAAGFMFSKGRKPGPDTPGFGVASENRHGFVRDLRVKIPKAGTTLPDKPLFTIKTNNANAQRQLESLNEIAKLFPDPLESTESWSRMMSYALADTDVPIPPYNIIDGLASGETRDMLASLTRGQLADADHGFQNAAEFYELYTTGQMGVDDTGRILMWSFLSRGVSPYTQESMFIDAFSGIDKWIKLAAKGKFTKAVAGGAYAQWAETVSPKGSGKPGSGTQHNLNAFGENFLVTMSQPIEKGGVTRLQYFHDMLANKKMTGQQIRREFLKFGEGAGIDNKVISFTLLVTGRTDVLVLDRVQMRHLFDDGRFADRNLYDGIKVPKIINGKEQSVVVTGTPLANLTYGARGLAVYEAIERSLLLRIKDLYKSLKRMKDASLGRFHWETWVAYSGQEASHATLDSILRRAQGEKKPLSGVTAKEGEYGRYAYGARYGRDERNLPAFWYDTSDGVTHKFTIQSFREFLDAIRNTKEKVRPKKFNVDKDEAGNDRRAPWFEDPRVDREKLDSLVRRYGKPEGEKRAPVRKPDQDAVPDGPRLSAASLKVKASMGRRDITDAMKPEPPSLDDLGFSSPTLEAAKRMKQKKGPLDQMKAVLLNAGASPAEMEAVGLDKVFAESKTPSDSFWSSIHGFDATISDPDFARAIDDWVGGPYDAIEKGIDGGIMIPSTLENMSAIVRSSEGRDVRNALYEDYGEHIVVYRGEREGGTQSTGRRNIINSYTTDKNVAIDFTGAPKERKIIPEADIARAEQELEKTGQTTLAGYTFRKEREQIADTMVEYIGLYYAGREDSEGMITDTDGPRAQAEDMNAQARENNAKRERALKGLREVRIPVASVIWATDRFNQKEIIAYAGDELPARKKITRDEIIAYMNENRIILRESVYRYPKKTIWIDDKEYTPEEFIDAVWPTEPTPENYQGEMSPKVLKQILDRARKQGRAEMDTVTRTLVEAARKEMGLTTHEEMSRVIRDVDKAKPVKFPGFSLDPSNETYTEDIIFMPPDVPYRRGTPGAEVAVEPMRSHFNERNVVGHTMSSFVKFKNKLTLLLDQIQSDWGQKLREGGVRDVAKIEELNRRSNELYAYMKAKQQPFDDMLTRIKREDENLGHVEDFLKTTLSSAIDHPDRWTQSDENRVYRYFPNITADDIAFAKEMFQVIRDMNLVEHELRVEESAAIGHPLVNTTDRWLNLTLNRSLMRAVAENADYIAIPHGTTVLSYNPEGMEGPGGMRAFYGSTLVRDEVKVKEIKDDIKHWDAVAKKAYDDMLAIQERHKDLTYKVKPEETRDLRQLRLTRDDAEYTSAQLARDLRQLQKWPTEIQEGIVPKNLRKILEKIDKEAAKPIKAEAVETPNGMNDRGNLDISDGGKDFGFTIYRLTDDVKKHFLEKGASMFSMGRRDRSAPRLDAATKARAEALGFDVSQVWYHGTPDARGIWADGFKTKTEQYGNVDASRVFFFSDRKTAGTYADDRRAFDYQNAEPQTIPVYLKPGKQKVIDWGGKQFRGRDKDGNGFAMRDHIDQARAEGYDSVLIRNVRDTYDAKGTPSTVVALFNPSAIRSVNASFDPDQAASTQLKASKGRFDEQARAAGFDTTRVLYMPPSGAPPLADDKVFMSSIDKVGSVPVYVRGTLITEEEYLKRFKDIAGEEDPGMLDRATRLSKLRETTREFRERGVAGIQRVLRSNDDRKILLTRSLMMFSDKDIWPINQDPQADIKFSKGPRRAYHWTPFPGQISTFNPFSHFGTAQAAYERFLRPSGTFSVKDLEEQRMRPGSVASGGTIPVDLNMKNPLRIEDTGTHNPASVAYDISVGLMLKHDDAPKPKDLVEETLQIYFDNMTDKQVLQLADKTENIWYLEEFDVAPEDGPDWLRKFMMEDIIRGIEESVEEGDSRREAGSVSYNHLFNIVPPDNATWEHLSKVLNDYGHDGLVYRNIAEDEGKDSYIATQRGTVTNALTGEVMFSRGREAPAQLNSAISKLKKALGIETSQTLMGATVKVGDRKMRMRVKRNKMWQFRRDTGGLGIRQSRDIKAIARAGSYALRNMIGAPLDDILKDHRSELVPPGVLLTEEVALERGFETFFERYVMDREGAKKMAPNFFEAFEDTIDAHSPTMLKGIDAASQEYDAWTKRATVDELASDLVSGYGKNDWKTISGEGKNFAEITNGRMAAAYKGTVDKNSPIKKVIQRLLGVADQNNVRDEKGRRISLKVSENAHKLAAMFRGAHAAGYTYLTEGIPSYQGGAIKHAPLTKALNVLFGGNKWNEGTFKAFGQYLVARRAIAEYDRLEEKEKKIAAIEKQLAQDSQTLSQLRTAQSAETQRLEERSTQLVRVEAQLRLRRSDLNAARKEDTRLQNRVDELRFQLAEALAAIDDGSDLAKKVRDRTRDQLVTVERDALRAKRRVEALEPQVDSLETDAAFLRSESAQLQQLTEGRQALLDTFAGTVERLKTLKANTEKAGASKPPTLEGRDVHQRYIDKIHADPRFARAQEAAEIVYEFTRGLLTLRYEAGLIPADQYAELLKRADYYVPFMRDMSDDPSSGSHFSASGSSRTWTPFKQFQGSDRAIRNPLEVLSEQAYTTAQHIAINDIVKTLANLAERVGPGGARIVEVLERRTEHPEAFERVIEIAQDFGMDLSDAMLIAQQMEVDFESLDLEVLWSPQTKGPGAAPTLPLWKDGKRVFVSVNDPEFGQDVVNALKGLGKEQMGIIAETFGYPARALQIGVTTHPTFMPRNLFRDIIDASVKAGAIPVLAQIEGAFLMANKKLRSDLPEDFMRKYLAAGGITGGRNVAAQTMKEQQRDVLKLDPKFVSKTSVAIGAVSGAVVGTILAGPIGTLVGGALVGWGTRGGQIVKLVESVETMTRMGVAAHAYREAIANNPELTEQEAILEAAFIARDVFDWNRRGSGMLEVVRMITFLNAQIQGLDKSVRVMVGEGERGNVIFKAKKSSATVGTGAAVGAAAGGLIAGPIGGAAGAYAGMLVARHLNIVMKNEQGLDLSRNEERDLANAYKTWMRVALYTLTLMGLYALAADDDDYDDLNDRTKFTHSWLPGWLGTDIRIPKAFEWAVPANMIEILYEAYQGKDPRFASRLLDSVYEVIVPPAIPQGYTLATGGLTGKEVQSVLDDPRDIIPFYEQGESPETQFNAYTSWLSRDMVQAMARAGIPERMQPSPYMIDFALRTGGYWGKDMQRSYDYTRQAVTDTPTMEPRVPDWPVIGGFTGTSARQSESVDQFYRLMRQSGGLFTSAARSYKDYFKDQGNPERAEEYLQRLPRDRRAYALLQMHGEPEDKNMHPLNRMTLVNRSIGSVARDVAANLLTPGKRRGRNMAEEKGSIIEIDPKTKTAVIDTLEKLRRAEAWNTMIVMERPGWQGKSERSTKLILDTLKSASPQAYEVLMERFDEAKVEDFKDVREGFKELENRFLERKF